jgi:predicted N-formylglutamate amidohydrolase
VFEVEQHDREPDQQGQASDRADQDQQASDHRLDGLAVVWHEHGGMDGHCPTARSYSRDLAACPRTRLPCRFRIVGSGGRSAVLLTADHAGRSIPRSLAKLQLSDEVLETHGAWDLGVAALAERLSARLDAVLILHNYSRLVIDVNHPPWAPDSIVVRSENALIPSNRTLSSDVRRRGPEAQFEPCHRRIAAELDGRSRQGQPGVLVAVHSFTPVHGGQRRIPHVELEVRQDLIATTKGQQACWPLPSAAG